MLKILMYKKGHVNLFIFTHTADDFIQHSWKTEEQLQYKHKQLIIRRLMLQVQQRKALDEDIVRAFHQNTGYK